MGGVEVQISERVELPSAELPSHATLAKWCDAALAETGRSRGEITLRLVDAAEMRQLNARFRGKSEPTNVLAFPFVAGVELPEGAFLRGRPLGDIVICVATVKAEAQAQTEDEPAARAPHHQFARMVIHGTLHLCGYDHQTPTEAEVMEAAEKKILHALGFGD